AERLDQGVVDEVHVDVDAAEEVHHGHGAERVGDPPFGYRPEDPPQRLVPAERVDLDVLGARVGGSQAFGHVGDFGDVVAAVPADPDGLAFGADAPRSGRPFGGVDGLVPEVLGLLDGGELVGVVVPHGVAHRRAYRVPGVRAEP